MGLTSDIGRRIELVAMDPHFHEISMALYRREREDGPQLLVHTYSRIEGALQRVESVAAAMVALGGMQPVEGDAQRVRFPCGRSHHMASRRLFLEACKLPPASDATPRPLHVFDKKSSANVTVTSLGEGAYQLHTDGQGDKVAMRRAAIAGGLVKLAEMEWLERDADKIAFPCGRSHDKLVGLLLVRAQNVRSVERELEAAAARGQLLAPSAQKQ